MGRNFANLVQAGLSRAKDLPNRDKQGKTRLNRLKWGLMVVNRGELGYNGVKVGKWVKLS